MTAEPSLYSDAGSMSSNIMLSLSGRKARVLDRGHLCVNTYHY